MNLNEPALNSQGGTNNTNSTVLSTRDYSGILNSFSKEVTDAKLKQMLDQLQAQIIKGDAVGAEATRQQILKYIDQNPQVAPYGLYQLLSSSALQGMQKNGGGNVNVDLQALSKSMQPASDLSDNAAARAQNLQQLAQMFSDNPALKNQIMSMSNLVNFGMNKDARTVYGQIDADLLGALLKMDPDLVTKAFESLGEGIGPVGNIKQPQEAPRPSEQTNPFPRVGDLASPVAGAPVAFSSLPSVNLANPLLLLFVIALPIFLLLLFIFQNRLQVALPKMASTVAHRIVSSETAAQEAEPADPRQRVFYQFRRLVRVMGARGAVKPDYETHREFAARCAGRSEGAAVKSVSNVYEEARFTDDQISSEEANQCAHLVDSVEKAEK
ncbi:MAG: DUF4129 domain-containing protein [Thaumarchaeota archaeon]|nr:DUF4129 domain-containing protein [Nitrososphaerota archaeon]